MFGSGATEMGNALFQAYLDLDSATTQQELDEASKSLSKLLSGPIVDALMKVVVGGAAKGTAAFNKRYKVSVKVDPNTLGMNLGNIKVKVTKRQPTQQKSKRDFEGMLRGEKVKLPGVKTQNVTYKKRDRAATAVARRQFDSTHRPAFLKGLVADPGKRAQLKKAGLTDKDIAAMKKGKVPEGYDVHHKVPLDAGGTNDAENLVLTMKEPYHKVITNWQNQNTRGMKPGNLRRFAFPIPGGFIYPP